MSTIKEQYKIPILSLSKAIERKEITVTQAYKQASENLEFEGTFVDFIEMLKREGLIDKDTQTTKKADNKVKVVKAVKFTAAVLIVVAVVKIMNKK